MFVSIPRKALHQQKKLILMNTYVTITIVILIRFNFTLMDYKSL